MRAREADVSFRDVKIKIPNRGMWMTSCTGSARRILGDLKKSVELRTRHRTRRVDFRGSLRPDEFVRYGHRTRWGGGRWKSHHRKIVHLSSLCRKELKGNERFRTWTKKSLRVFCVSGFLCSMYICYEHSMYVSHISVSGYGTLILPFIEYKNTAYGYKTITKIKPPIVYGQFKVICKKKKIMKT